MGRKIRNVALLLPLLLLVGVASAHAQPKYNDPRMPQTDEEKKFYSLVARNIFQIEPGVQGRFGLMFDERHPPAFAGEAENSLEPASCERLAAFGILGFATELGHIGAALCNDGANVRRLAKRSGAALERTLKSLGAGAAQARAAGWRYTEETLGDGAEFYYFPVLLIGHGVVGPYTGVVYDPGSGRAAVIQMEARQLCGENFRDEFARSQFCTDMPGALKRLALALKGFQ